MSRRMMTFVVSVEVDEAALDNLPDWPGTSHCAPAPGWEIVADRVLESGIVAIVDGLRAHALDPNVANFVARLHQRETARPVAEPVL